MEHLGLHAAAHVFFENKLDDLTSEFNGKMKKMQAFVQKELRKLHDIHMGEVKKLKQEVTTSRVPHEHFIKVVFGNLAISSSAASCEC